MFYLRFHFAIKVDFKSEGGGVKNGAAVIAVAQMVLNLTCHLRSEAPFKIFANQSNCCLTCHAHDSVPPEPDWLDSELEHATNQRANWIGKLVPYRFKMT
jgi:hypothetical protein